MRRTVYTDLATPVGTLILAGHDGGLTHVLFAEGPGAERPQPGWEPDARGLGGAVEQLAAYFAGQRCVFDLALAPEGTAFQRAVWAAVREIPYGATASYADVARRIGRPRAVRAVGAANGRNPLAIVVPCHRVIGSDGRLTGYGGGLDVKQALLALERGGHA